MLTYFVYLALAAMLLDILFTTFKGNLNVSSSLSQNSSVTYKYSWEPDNQIWTCCALFWWQCRDYWTSNISMKADKFCYLHDMLDALHMDHATGQW